MKIRYFMLIVFSLSFNKCFLSACGNDNNLTLMTYDSPNSAEIMSLDGEKYFWIAPAPNNLQKDQKIARVKTEENLPSSYVYTIKGYERKDFIIVEERTVGLVLDLYMHDKIKNIPWELLDGNVMIEGDEYIKFNNKNYYYFTKTQSDFLVDRAFSDKKRWENYSGLKLKTSLKANG